MVILVTRTPVSDRHRYDRATAHLDGPVAVVDLAAFDANAADLVRRAGGKPIRVASKSLRCRALLERALAVDGFAGASPSPSRSGWPVPACATCCSPIPPPTGPATPS